MRLQFQPEGWRDSDATFPLSLEQGRSLGCDIKAGRAKMLRVICHQGSERERRKGKRKKSTGDFRRITSSKENIAGAAIPKKVGALDARPP